MGCARSGSILTLFFHPPSDIPYRFAHVCMAAFLEFACYVIGIWLALVVTSRSALCWPLDFSAWSHLLPSCCPPLHPPPPLPSMFILCFALRSSLTLFLPSAHLSLSSIPSAQSFTSWVEASSAPSRSSLQDRSCRGSDHLRLLCKASLPGCARLGLSSAFLERTQRIHIYRACMLDTRSAKCPCVRRSERASARLWQSFFLETGSRSLRLAASWRLALL